MALTVITGPTQEPLSLQEAKDHLRVTAADEDGLIAGYILAARQFVEDQTRRRFLTQTLDYTLDDWPYTSAGGYYRTRIELPVLPVASITSLKYYDTTGTQQTMSSSDYVLRNATGPIAYIEPAYGVTWPAVRCQSEAITVRMVVGGTLSEVPNPLMQAMRMMIGHWYANREAINIGNIVTQLDFAVEALISPYRPTRLP